jgi:hypothetical protein
MIINKKSLETIKPNDPNRIDEIGDVTYNPPPHTHTHTEKRTLFLIIITLIMNSKFQ